MNKHATETRDEIGLSEWVKAISEVTTPLLAGFSVTSVIAVSADSDKFRWPGQAILALTIASVALIVAVLAAYHARMYLHSEDGKLWVALTRNAYHVGVLALLAGLALVLAPLNSKGLSGNLRWSATCVAGFRMCRRNHIYFWSLVAVDFSPEPEFSERFDV
jgi:uncharacterized membrane protein HdeD (DUF308 family)